jgi:hypothetical protein
VIDDCLDKIDRSLTLSWPMLDRNLFFFIRFRTEKERSPSVFATGSVRYSCVLASRGALGHGLHRLCLNPPLCARYAAKPITSRDALRNVNHVAFPAEEKTAKC